jgi:hypothetical protein
MNHEIWYAKVRLVTSEPFKPSGDFKVQVFMASGDF